MFKAPKQAYPAEFKAAVQRVKDGQGVSAVVCELGCRSRRSNCVDKALAVVRPRSWSVIRMDSNRFARMSYIIF